MTPMPVISETGFKPPSAAKISSTVLSMGGNYPRSVEVVNGHALEIDSALANDHSVSVTITAERTATRLLMLREHLGITQAEFARSVAISPTRMNNFETGFRRLTLDVASKICDRYGVTLDWLYRGDPSGLPTRLGPLTELAA